MSHDRDLTLTEVRGLLAALRRLPLKVAELARGLERVPLLVSMGAVFPDWNSVLTGWVDTPTS